MSNTTKKVTGNGCFLDVCEFYVGCRCISEEDTVSKEDGQPICPFNKEKAIPAKEYKARVKISDEERKKLEVDRALERMRKMKFNAFEPIDGRQIICVWPDGMWCPADSVDIFKLFLSDDFAVFNVPEELTPDEIEHLVADGTIKY